MPKGKAGSTTYVEFTCQACGIAVRRTKQQAGRAKACSRACAARLIGGGREARFWSNVQKGDGCWLWTGAHDEKGYGVIRPKDGGMIRTHRYMWTLENGPIPAGSRVLHRCDNPPCCKPEHLFIGTQRDNIRDMIAKGRQRFTGGRRGPNPKLVERNAIIAARHAAGEKRRHLAAEYGLSPAYLTVLMRRQQPPV